MRKKIVFGNWKMNMDARKTRDFADKLKAEVGSLETVEMGICPPFVYLASLASLFQGSRIVVGAQNLFYEKEGAYTGQISGAMLRDIGAAWVLIGHSETRHTIGNLKNDPDFVGESDAFINKKVHAALRDGLKVILCIGEMLHERKAGKTDEINRRQLTEGLKDITAEQIKNIVIAYEPVWAIGTGVNATPEQAQETHVAVRKVLKDLFGEKTAAETRIQYGGSAKSSNAKELISKPDVDGFLVGGASLKADEFAAIIKSVV